jgi:2-amino-4-hydroxy-6-hydroxymethyldihydropteridine diphosphokinase
MDQGDEESSPQRRRAFLGLGSNIEPRERFLLDAVEVLPDVVAVSAVYETEPLGPSSGDCPYLNLVVELLTERTPRDLLGIAHRLEAAAGRVRSAPNAPRTLDVDLLMVGDLQINQIGLILPHPRLYERRFVLAPLAQLAPELVPDHALEASSGWVRLIGPLPGLKRGCG